MTGETGNRERLLADTERHQERASSPTASAWVSANAGAGKTHVLKLRVLRLLLDGTAPERILCLTYTKAAAAEMSQRVFADLAAWATCDEASLRQALVKLNGKPADERVVSFARRLFARAIETPGGLKVQTIHAFCERLLQRFPLEAGVSPGFSTLDEQAAAALQREAIDGTLVAANADGEGTLAQALKTAVARAADERFDTILTAVLANRLWLDELEQVARAIGQAPETGAEAFYRRLFGLSEDDTATSLEQRLAEVLSADDARAAASVLDQDKKYDRELAARLMTAADAEHNAHKIAAFRDAFLTREDAPRKDSQFVSKAIRAAEPAISDRLVKVRDQFYQLQLKRLAVATVEATLALVCLGRQVIARYEAAKQRRAGLDFEDLIVKTSRLLAKADAADWILYKLDGGLDHILVDEAQDTSPLQWRVIEALAAEFYSGEGASETVRTVFAVGDEKQSIYSFQGAAPEQFARAGQKFSDLTAAAGRDWAGVPLTLSFRTVAPLLSAVDAIFRDERRTPGVGTAGGDVHHEALRIGEAGCVEIWPTVAPERAEPIPPFAPLEEPTAGVPARNLAQKIADKIHQWLEDGEELISQGRAVRASDILILVKRRRPFAPEMVRALKARNIPVAGADRIVLSEQIAVQDLIALGDFLVLPEDDLSLAAVLKSPLFGLDDDDLLRIAPQRRGSLWSALLAGAKTDPRFEPAATELKAWRALSDFAPPYEFYASLLDRDGCRARLIGRLGPDAADPLDEFMNLALTYDDQEPVSLQGFLAWLKDGQRQIKRETEQGRNEVSVMTVHGAKGLERPIVILPDTCSAPGGGIASPLVDLAGVEMPGQQRSPLAWAIKGSKSLPPIKGGRAVAAEREREEHNRLLYVALTRARDRLYITGFETKNGRQKGCWYDTVWSGLEGRMAEMKDRDGGTIWRLEAPQTVPTPIAQPKSVTALAVRDLPEWAGRRAPSEPQLSIPLAPSRLAPLETDEDGEPVPFDELQDVASEVRDPVPRSPTWGLAGDRFLRGNLTHALLEHLPGVAPDERQSVALKLLEARGQRLTRQVRQSIIDETLAILDDPVFAELFGPDSRAEVPIVAELARPHGSGPPLRLNGIIDRLARSRDGVLIADYKTNRRAPATRDGVPEIYIMQLAAYRLALSHIFPGCSIRAGLLWTASADLMEIPQDCLDDHQQRLWQLRTGGLDAA